MPTTQSELPREAGPPADRRSNDQWRGSSLRRIILVVVGLLCVGGGTLAFLVLRHNGEPSHLEALAKLQTHADQRLRDLPVSSGTGKDFLVAPVPPGAVIDPEYTVPTRRVFVVPTMTRAAVVAFYDREMPAGRPWNGHAWCRADNSTSKTVRSWRTDSPDGFITLAIMDDVDSGVRLWIIDDQDVDLDCEG